MLQALSYERTRMILLHVEPLFCLQLRLSTTTTSMATSLDHVTTLCKQGCLEEAVHSLYFIQSPLHSSIYVHLLQVCIKKRNLPQGKLIHSHMEQRGFTEDILSHNTLLNMYVKCGSVMDARRVFDQMTERDVCSWTVMIAAYARHGPAEEALALFRQMQRTGLQPDEFIFASILPACANLASLQQGVEIHERIIASGHQCDVVVVNALIDMYAKCRNIPKARKLFDKMHQRDGVSWTTMIAGYAYDGLVDESLKLFKGMPQRNVVTWNAMIAGFAQNGHAEEALGFFKQMQLAGIKPDSKTLISILPACADLAALQPGMEIHSLIIRSGFQSDLLVMGNALIDMYAKCRSIEKASQIFDRMHQRNVVSWTAMVAGFVQNGLIDEAMKLFKEMPHRNVASWNAMVAGLAQNEHGEKSLRLFGQMQLAGMQPDSKTFASGLLGCAQLVDLKLGMEIHGKIVIRGFQSDLFVMTALVEMYAQCGSIEKAQCLFGMMQRRDLVSWNVMITGYAENGLVNEALKLFKEMPQQNVISWNAIIAGFAQNGHGEDALKIFQQMQLEGVTPDSRTLAIILPVCANLAALQQGFEIHEKVISTGYQSDTLVVNALIDMYAKCGSIEKASKLFDKLNRRDLISWNSMIGGYAMHGCGKEALKLFEQMINSSIKPNHVSFVSVLSACNHAGLVEEGYQYFTCMSEYYDITPTMQHYKCMVDLLCRAGRLHEANDFINKMPITPDAVVLICLLGACRIHNNIELGQRVAEGLFELYPENDAPYVLISNIYAAVGRWSDIEKVRKMMKNRGIKKKPGCSWIEVNKQVHAFFVGEKLSF